MAARALAAWVGEDDANPGADDGGDGGASIGGNDVASDGATS